MKLSDAIKPISYLKAHASELIRAIADNRGTLIITQNGEAKVVMQDLQSYEETKESLAFLKMLAQSQKSKNEGEFDSVKGTFRKIEDRIKELD
ncbi:MAG: type II toxin-antitoxin system Phd/YefM family antitoxin [Planctomycetes bacterium]|nr:type II toxin-antitoxin system Phd/YefM family antitoxin [Planctomycetota bacterium]